MWTNAWRGWHCASSTASTVSEATDAVVLLATSWLEIDTTAEVRNTFHKRNHCWRWHMQCLTFHSDIDECMTGKHRCRTDEQCRNNDGGYDCVANCAPGHTRASNGTCIGVPHFRFHIICMLYWAFDTVCRYWRVRERKSLVPLESDVRQLSGRLLVRLSSRLSIVRQRSALPRYSSH